MSALFTIEIDNGTNPAPEKTMTANAILSLGGIDPKENYLIQIKRDSDPPPLNWSTLMLRNGEE